MKLIHTADLHIGKIVNEFSMLNDQKYILQQILSIVEEEKADGIIIAGDVYDRSIPPADAVTVLDWFLSSLIEKNVKVYLISGNHDSAERVGFANKILDAKGLYIGGTYDGTIKKVTAEKDGVKADIYLLPFVKPQVVEYYEQNANAESNQQELNQENISQPNTNQQELDQQDTHQQGMSQSNMYQSNKSQSNMNQQEVSSSIRTFESAVKASLSHLELDPAAINILVTHHFVTSGGILPEQSDSETSLSLGGIDKVDTSVFDAFDYVALGHIHRPQRIGRDTIRYAGSPLKYSFSEVTHKKSVTILEIGEDREITVRTKELIPLHDMRKIRGTMKDLMNPEYYELADTKDYIQATLTDTVELVDPIGTLRSVYPNIMQLILEKNQQETEVLTQNLCERKSKSALELFDDFYTTVTGREFDEKRREIIQEILESVTGGEKA